MDGRSTVSYPSGNVTSASSLEKLGEMMTSSPDFLSVHRGGHLEACSLLQRVHHLLHVSPSGRRVEDAKLVLPVQGYHMSARDGSSTPSASFRCVSTMLSCLYHLSARICYYRLSHKRSHGAELVNGFISDGVPHW